LSEVKFDLVRLSKVRLGYVRLDKVWFGLVSIVPYQSLPKEERRLG
jgi:hypothetical protein